MLASYSSLQLAPQDTITHRAGAVICAQTILTKKGPVWGHARLVLTALLLPLVCSATGLQNTMTAQRTASQVIMHLLLTHMVFNSPCHDAPSCMYTYVYVARLDRIIDGRNKISYNS